MAKNRRFNKTIAAVLFCSLLAMTGGFPFVSAAQEAAMGELLSSAQSISSEISPLPYEDTSLKKTEKPRQNLLSLDLRGIELSEFFKVLSKKLGKNIIPSKNVIGRIDLFLNDIRYEDVLDIIMVSQGLAYEEKSDNIIIVMTDSEYETLYGKKFNEKKEITTLKIKHAPPKIIFTTLSNLKSTIGNVIVDEVTGTLILIDVPNKIQEMITVFKEIDQPLATEIFEFQYAKVADIKDDISSILTDGASSIITDDRTNTIIITDLPGNMKKVMQAIKMLDQETRQVFIEAVIVQITLRDEFDYGIQWDAILNNPSLWGSTLAGSFPIAAAITTAGADQTISIGNIHNRGFSSVLTMLNTLGDTKILSRPRIAVTNNEEATIHIGTRQAIVTGTTSQSGESTISSDSVEFIDVGIKLVVSPVINRDGYITMGIKPEISSVTSTVTTGSEDEPRSVIPIITTSEAETTVKVKDGSMIMIAGFKEHDVREDISGMPFLSQIPILDLFFSNKDTQNNQTELIIFITPHIVKGDEMMPWDIEELDELPDNLRPGNRGYFEPNFKTTSLRKSRQTRR